MPPAEFDAIVLASSSPRRRQLLRQLGVQFSVIAADIEEIALPDEAPADFVTRMAREKALAVLRAHRPDRPVLGADTAVIVDGVILGKPAGRVQAEAMLRSLSGRTHEVYSAVAVAAGENRVYEALNVTSVTFATLPPEWIAAYCDTGDPMDKAGAYGVQGRAAEKISRIDGSFYCVMGLPLHETAELLKRAEVIF